MQRSMAQRAAAHPATITAVLGLILGVVVAVKAPLALAAGAAALGPAVALRRRFELALALMCWGVVKYSVIGQLGALSGVIPYAELALVVLVAVLSLLDEPADSWLARSRVWWIVPGFALALFVSWALNGRPLIALGAGYRSLLTMPLLALALARSMRTRAQFGTLYKAGILFTWLQVPMALYQFAFLGGSSSNVDVVSGTLGLGGSNVLGVWMLGATLAALWSYLRKPRSAAAISGMAFAVSMVFSSARLALYSAPLGLLILLVHYQRQKDAVSHRTLMVALSGVLVFAVAVLGTYSAYSSSGMRDAGASDTNLAGLVAAQSNVSGYGVPRLAYLAYSWDYIKSNSSFWPLGTGPATGGTGAASIMNDPGNSQFQTGFRLLTSGMGADTRTMLYFVNMPQAMGTMVDAGPVGFVLMIALYGTIGVLAYRRLLRLNAGPFAYTALAPAAALVFVVFVTVGTVYSVVWEGLSITGLCFWWFALMSSSGQLAEEGPADAGVQVVDE